MFYQLDELWEDLEDLILEVFRPCFYEIKDLTKFFSFCKEILDEFKYDWREFSHIIFTFLCDQLDTFKWSFQGLVWFCHFDQVNDRRNYEMEIFCVLAKIQDDVFHAI